MTKRIPIILTILLVLILAVGAPMCALSEASTQVIQRGDKSDDVRRLQERLVALGFLNGDCDGIFGLGTQNAVIRFQAAAGLPITGAADTPTLNALYTEGAPTVAALDAMATPAQTGLPEGPRVDDSYFNDAVFVGDSVTLKLDYYVRDKRNGAEPSLLGNAVFLCAGSMGCVNVQQPISADSYHPTYRGDKVYIEDAVAQLGAKKVYIMLGMNDIGEWGIADTISGMGALVTKIHQKAPDAKIFIQSVTPRLQGKDQKTLNNANLRIYDAALAAAVEALGSQSVYFVDVAYVMRGPDGCLPAEYCSDPEGQGIHFTDTACRAWIDYLYTHTA